MTQINKVLVIRKASIEDLSNIVELHTQSWRENYGDVLSSTYLREEIYPDRTKVWSSRLTSSPANQLILIAELGNEFCGFVCGFGAKHREFGTIIDNLHVRSNCKGKGIGTKLLVAAAKWAVTNFENDNLYLEVLEGNSKAIKFYESLGGKNIATAYWHTPCGNDTKELIYSWGSPQKLANKFKNENASEAGTDVARTRRPF